MHGGAVAAVPTSDPRGRVVPAAAGVQGDAARPLLRAVPAGRDTACGSAEAARGQLQRGHPDDRGARGLSRSPLAPGNGEAQPVAGAARLRNALLQRGLGAVRGARDARAGLLQRSEAPAVPVRGDDLSRRAHRRRHEPAHGRDELRPGGEAHGREGQPHRAERARRGGPLLLVADAGLELPHRDARDHRHPHALARETRLVRSSGPARVPRRDHRRGHAADVARGEGHRRVGEMPPLLESGLLVASGVVLVAIARWAARKRGTRWESLVALRVGDVLVTEAVGAFLIGYAVGVLVVPTERVGPPGPRNGPRGAFGAPPQFLFGVAAAAIAVLTHLDLRDLMLGGRATRNAAASYVGWNARVIERIPAGGFGEIALRDGMGNVT